MLPTAQSRHKSQQTLPHLIDLSISDLPIQLVRVNRPAITEKRHLRPCFFPIRGRETVNLELIGALVDIHRAPFILWELLPWAKPVHDLALRALRNARLFKKTGRPGT